MADGRLVAFVGGPDGPWRLDGLTAPSGEPLRPVAHLAVVEGPAASAAAGTWVLRGVAATERRAGAGGRDEPSPPPGSTDARCAALLAVRQSAAWWALDAGERARLLEQSSRPAAPAGEGEPVIARRLHHSRDLGEPFDYLAWFEFDPGQQGAFNDLLAATRAGEGWSFVEREVDIRLSR